MPVPLLLAEAHEVYNDIRASVHMEYSTDLQTQHSKDSKTLRKWADKLKLWMPAARVACGDVTVAAAA